MTWLLIQTFTSGNEEGWTIGVEKLGAYTGLSRASVFRALAELRAAGLILVDKTGRANRYQMVYPSCQQGGLKNATSEVSIVRPLKSETRRPYQYHLSGPPLSFPPCPPSGVSV